MENYTLKNGIKTSFIINKNTPRTALVMYAGINEAEKITGLYYLTARMLFQGTKNRTSEELASELDENAIDISIDKKSDFIVFKIYCLNEDIEHGLEILQDIIENAVFDDYGKEIIKIKGEFESDLDSAKVQAQDNYYRTIFKNHPYGAGRKEITASLDKITKQDLISAFDEIRYKMQKNIVIAGDINIEKFKQLLDKYFAALKISNNKGRIHEVKEIETDTIETAAKEDANQAQIFQGWIVPSVFSRHRAAFIVLNSILGASGLSSRLFLELREKKGLAYTVRSVYEPYLAGGNFYFYIASEPKNIAAALDGFKIELKRIMTEPIGIEELENAKNNAIGRRQFMTETNSAEASLTCYYEASGLGAEFEEELTAKIKALTPDDIIKTAAEFFGRKSVLCILAPEKYLKEAGVYNK